MAFVVIFFVLIAIAGSGFAFSMHNALRNKWRRTVEGWSGIEALLGRRLALTSELLSSVRPYLKDHAALDAVAAARSEVASSVRTSPLARVRAERRLSRALSELIAAAEAEPGLWGETAFVVARNELARVEGGIRATCRCYNDNVRNLNTAMSCFPCNLMVDSLGLKKQEPFNIEGEAEVRARVPAFS